MDANDVALIINRDARLGAEALPAAIAAFSPTGRIVRLARTVSADKVQETVQEALELSCGRIVVGGGDGTLNLAIQQMRGADAQLGILPLGTGNALARDLKIPLNLQEACEQAAKPEVRNIDLGEANGTLFVNLASVGLIGEVARRLDHDQKKTIGRLAYLKPMAEALKNAPTFRVTIRQGRTLNSFDTMLVAAGCGGTQGGVVALPTSPSDDDGLLTLYSLKSEDANDYVELAWRLSQGDEQLVDSLLVWHVEAATIETKPTQKLFLDGEERGSTPVELKAVPQAITVAAPPPV